MWIELLFTSANASFNTSEVVGCANIIFAASSTFNERFDNSEIKAKLTIESDFGSVLNATEKFFNFNYQPIFLQPLNSKLI